MGRSSMLLVWIALAIGALGALATWDERREQAAALDDLAAAQSTLARTLACALETMPTADAAAVRRLFSSVELPGSTRVLLAARGERFRGSAGEEIRASVGEQMAAGAQAGGALRLSHDQAAALGLPPRMAMVGFATVHGDPSRTLAVAQTALAERNRQIRAEWRITLGFLLASALVVAFGSWAMRKQRAELALAHELAVAEAVRSRDERLVRADKLATMGALATGVAHEVSTPLGIIVGRAEQIVRGLPEGDRLHLAAGAIHEQAERISRIIRGLLDLARGGSPALEAVSASSLAQAAADLVAHRFAQARVTLDGPTDGGGADPAVRCDPRLFEQVLVNLLLNACEASPEGTRVELSLRSEGDHVVFRVLDEGQGITPEAARRATEPFFTTKGQLGTGLGLSIAREIVQHHRGRLALVAREDAPGTMALVTVPEARSTARASDEPDGLAAS